jgi:hypothetical protein
MVPLETVDVRRSYDPLLMRKAFAMGSDPDYDSSSTSAHAFAASTTSCTSTTSRSAPELQEADVVGGRSPMTHTHPGNRVYNTLVKAHSRQYKATSNRAEKSRITNEIIAQVESHGGRFLVEENGEFVEVCLSEVRCDRETCETRADLGWLTLPLQMDRKSIHEKVAHALRSKKDQVTVKIRRPRKKAGQQPPSGEEHDYFDQLLLAQQSYYGEMVGQGGAAGAARDEGEDEYDDDDDEEEDDGEDGDDAPYRFDAHAFL